ncbi:E3 ubiquitin-protein ligase PRT6 isoform X2 [Physcomitrium patens]|nr:E3 ubiquitin-protein ligase PRT6-like isoform X2 [Physcomitrium patens]XP_024369768.1 E3 ubiquitin-protein ligase PRT6-like isoform X2 [Physcomitrium patens]XP_024369769.1 E3 ubiquitin-protein ligase PRT6-like isoform X2 [Physcomitrium patens]PNR58506.1 hypothetical protein PHYPA_005501 [Physcomitrium patens]|eukprot:XP_024369767.1 E3 ubiquitin-protein ligase PRT6-like isoform X2 [Physcomitrella patens]
MSSLFPGPEELQTASALNADETQGPGTRKEFLNQCRDAVKWVRWAMFQGEPQVVLGGSGGARGVCGAVWGVNDIAYRCRTCEHDPTCAICVPCFQLGNHSTHDYCMIRTGGGCCDCGDMTAWKQSGFCSRHCGFGQAVPLPSSIIEVAAPILEALLVHWVQRLKAADAVMEGKSKKWSDLTEEEKVASQLSVVFIELLLEFCSYGEPMLAFTAELMGKNESGILDSLMNTEYFLPKSVRTSLHELLYKLLGDSNFKLSFAQVFISHYPKFFQDSVAEENASTGSPAISKYREQTILNSFSVQIFTVPTLTPKLVMESRLLDMLLDTLKEFFRACSGEDGRLLVSKGPVAKRLYFRMLEDIRYVMSHLEVSKYVAERRPELTRAWLHMLALVQGMYPQRRITSNQVEEENDDWGSAYFLENQMATIHPFFVAGAAEASNASLGLEQMPLSKSSACSGFGSEASSSRDSVSRLDKVGCTMSEPNMTVLTSSGGPSGPDVEMRDVTVTVNAVENAYSGRAPYSTEKVDVGDVSHSSMTIPASLAWLISECIQVLDTWLALDVAREGSRPGHCEEEGSPSRVSKFRDWLRRTRRFQVLEPRVWSDAVREDAFDTTAASRNSTADMDVDVLGATVFESEENVDIGGAGLETDAGGTEWWMGSEAVQPAPIAVYKDEEWVFIDFDVSRQEVSFHIPLHRMLGLLLHKALDLHAVNTEASDGTAFTSASIHTPGRNSLGHMFPPGLQMAGFISVLMEHPLRLQVLCAQVQAGMWRRNGHSTSGLFDLYHSVHWCEDGLELDLFLLQCCAVMAPSEEFVERLQARFALSDFFTLVLWRPNEYEVTLAQELLVMMIRLVSERGYCGLTEVEALRRELVLRLAVGDATHSALLKALPPRLQESKRVQECLNAVATYRNPSGMQQGKYVLRESCWCELDLYHPRWIPRELQLAEDRYLRACKTPAVIAQLPRWKQPFKQMQNLGRIIISRRVHDMLRSIFFHAAFAENLSKSRAPEGLLLSALHLLALALDVCVAYKLAVGDTVCGAKSTICPSLDLNVYSDGASTSTGDYAEDVPPLLLGSVEKVEVALEDGSTMEEDQSMLSLLVLLLRKNNTGDTMTTSAIGNYNIGGLIKSLLRRFGELNQNCMSEIELLAPEILERTSTTGATQQVDGSGGNSCEDDSSVSELTRTRALARERQAAAMAKMKAAQERFFVNYRSEEEADAKRTRESEEGNDDTLKETQVHCALCRDSASASPLCFLVFTQKSKLLSIAERTTPSWECLAVTPPPQAEREGEVPGGPGTLSTSVGDGTSRDLQSPAELWHWIQEALGDAQTRSRFLEGEDFLELLRNGLPPRMRNAVRATPAITLEATVPLAGTDSEEVEFSSEITDAEISIEAGTSDSPGTSPLNWWDVSHGGAELDESSINRDIAAATVLAEYVTAVSRPQEWVRRGTDSPREVDADQGREGALTLARRVGSRNAPPIIEAALYNSTGVNDTVGVYLSACGHAVHQDCRDRYFSSLLQRYHSRALFEGVQIVDPDLGEFLCPVCRRLANAVLPVLPGHTGLNNPFKSSSIPQISVSSTSDGPPMLQLEHALRMLIKAEELVSKSGFRKVVDPQLPDTVKGVLEDLAKRLWGLFYPGKDQFNTVTHGRVHQSLLLWDVLRYSLMSAELAARSNKISENSASGLVALVDAGDATHGSILPLLLHAAKATQSQSHQAVLLRARGMQLLRDSIANGISRDLFAEKALHGNFSSLLQYLDKGHDAADVQFWKRLADPVLVHDPFSSFLWLLFCLPLPFPANGAPFTALVHLFYLVSVTQVIAQAGAFLTLDTVLGPTTMSFVASIHASLVGTCLQPSSYHENVFNPASLPLVAIRRLTLPFLRSCYLLQNLMAGSSQVLPVGRAHQWELPQEHSIPEGSSSSFTDSGDSQSQVLQDMEELDQLESTFCIPYLTKILEEDLVQNIVLRWCSHVKIDTGMRYLRSGPRLRTAAPFRLMHLPRLFQELLQRYVKERCPRCKTVPDRPALCLLCGDLCCAVGPRPCCSVNRQGECYRHAMVCGAGIGVFLMLRRTNILLQRCERQAMWPSPYLDAFGEEDIELRRGRPLYLSEERYSALTAMVAAHGLDYSSPVLSHTTRDTVF